MTPRKIIEEVQENAGEWLEMCENQDEMIKQILATKIIQLKNEIEFLEMRLDYVTRTSN